MPIKGKGWEIHIQRTKVQTRGAAVRTVGSYQVFHNGIPAASISVENVPVPLSGTTAESPGPGQNDHPATTQHPSRILAGRYPLMTSGGPNYKTHGYRPDLQIVYPLPGIELMNTGARSAILIHPGKNAFLSSIGCINLCTVLPDPDENIDFPGSRRRVIALIEDMKQFLAAAGKALPAGGDVAIPDASIVIDGEPVPVAQAALGLAVVSAGGTIDGAAVAAQHGVGVKSGAKISALHPAMAAVIAAVAQAAKALKLPKPVITSGNDSNHMEGSLHFKNRALDFRGNNITIAQGKSFDAAVEAILGQDYDVIFETFPNAANNHLHVEFQP